MYVNNHKKRLLSALITEASFVATQDTENTLSWWLNPEEDIHRISIRLSEHCGRGDGMNGGADREKEGL